MTDVRPEPDEPMLHRESPTDSIASRVATRRLALAKARRLSSESSERSSRSSPDWLRESQQRYAVQARKMAEQVVGNLVISASSTQCVVTSSRTFEAVSPLKVRKAPELCSPLVTTIEAGTRVKIVDVRRTSDGGQRACVAHALGSTSAEIVAADDSGSPKSVSCAIQSKPIGWVTARRSRVGEILLRLEKGEAVKLKASMAPFSHHSAIKFYSEYADEVNLSYTKPAWPPTLSDLQAAGRAKAHLPPPAELQWPLVFFSSSSALGSSTSASPMDSRVINGISVDDEADTSNGGDTVGSGASSGISSEKRRKKPTRRLSRAWINSRPLQREDADRPLDQSPSEADAAVGSASPSKEQERFVFQWMSSAELSTKVNDLMNQATFEESKSSMIQALNVRVGDKLRQKQEQEGTDQGTFLSNLIKLWDPNRDGDISKMEFRNNIRTLLNDKTVATQDIDGLFMQLDADGSGEMDTQEMKQALVKLEKASIKQAADIAAQKVAAAKIRAKAADVQKVVDQTIMVEKAEEELEERAGGSVAVGSRLGQILNKKGARAPAMLKQWCGSAGQLSKALFFNEMNVLGLEATRTETDALFDTFDAEGRGTVDLNGLLKAMTTLQQQAEENKALYTELKHRLAELTRVATSTQTKLQKMMLKEALTEKEEKEKLAREKKEKLAAVAQAKAAKAAAVAEKTAAAVAEKAAFEAKVNLKRRQSQADVTVT